MVTTSAIAAPIAAPGAKLRPTDTLTALRELKASSNAGGPAKSNIKPQNEAGKEAALKQAEGHRTEKPGIYSDLKHAAQVAAARAALEKANALSQQSQSPATSTDTGNQTTGTSTGTGDRPGSGATKS